MILPPLQGGMLVFALLGVTLRSPPGYNRIAPSGLYNETPLQGFS